MTSSTAHEALAGEVEAPVDGNPFLDFVQETVPQPSDTEYCVTAAQLLLGNAGMRLVVIGAALPGSLSEQDNHLYAAWSYFQPSDQKRHDVTSAFSNSSSGDVQKDDANQAYRVTLPEGEGELHPGLVLTIPFGVSEFFEGLRRVVEDRSKRG